MNDIGGRRLWIGNLDERITEFTLLKILQKYGKIEQFDFLFHKSGPNQGKPRGYCFASFEKRTDAVHALHSLDGKLALGKKLAVKWAHSHIKAPSDPVPLEPVINLNPDKIPGTFGGHATKVAEEPAIKKKAHSANVDHQIRAIEGKLRDMERQNAKATFKPIPVYASKRPKSPTEVTEKCLPSLLSISVEPPPESTASVSSSTAPSTSSSTASSASSTSSTITTSAAGSSSSGASKSTSPSSTTTTSASSSSNEKPSSSALSSSHVSSSKSSTAPPSSISSSSSLSSSSSSLSSSTPSSLSSSSSSDSTVQAGNMLSSSSSVAAALSSSSSSVSSNKSNNPSSTVKSIIVKPSGKSKTSNRPKPYDKR